MHKRIRATSVFTAVVVLIFSISFLVPIQTVQAQDFSIDQTSPEVPAPWSAADGIFWFGVTSPTVFSSGGIGLTPSDNVNAFSYGLDYFAAANQNSRIEFRFSVDRPTVGMPASIVNAQVTGNGAAGDKYGFVADGLGAVVTSTFLSSDAPSHSLTTLPGQSEIDGLSMSGVPAPEPIFPSPVYFSIDIATAASVTAVWGFTASTADIYYVPAPVGAGAGPVIPTHYAPLAFLGLMAGDDIDAVAIQDLGQLGLFDGTDQVFLSLAPGSPTLAAMGASPADILLATPGPSLVVYVPASTMGLLSTDNIDALAAFDPEGDPVECEANGDVNGDGNLSVADIAYLIDYLNRSGPEPIPPYSADVNSDCVIDTFDIIALTEALAGQLALPVPTCCVVSVEFFECCVGVRGNVDGDANDIIDIADLTFLIDHLYINNPPVGCFEEGNLNGDTLGINMADLILLIDHLFGNFPPLPSCDSSISTISVDVFNPDTLRLVVTDTQLVNGDLNFAVELWIYNDAQNVVGMEAGFGWNSPNMQMISSTSTPLVNDVFVSSFESFDNSTRQFQFAGFRFSGNGLLQFPTAKHIATYQMTYSNWTPDDVITFDTVRFRNAGYGLVGADNRMWFPEFVSLGTGFGFTGNGGATVDNTDGVITVSNIGSSGDDGVSITVPGSEPFVGMEIGNIDLAVPDISLTLDVTGEVGSPVGLARGNLPPQLVGAIGIATAGGAIQLSADFSSLGDPNVQFEVYNGPLLTGGASVPGGGVVAIGGDAGFGMPVVTSLTYSGVSPPSFTINLDRATRFTLTNGTILIGDKIRLIGVNATGSVDLVSTINVNASGIGFFTLTGVTTSSTGFCCLGFTGNINCDTSDLINIADLTQLIDHLFINFPPLCCPKEGNIDGDINGTVDIADLTALIDFLFINFTATSPCQ